MEFRVMCVPFSETRYQSCGYMSCLHRPKPDECILIGIMKDRCSAIFFYFVVLSVVAIIAATENESVQSIRRRKDIFVEEQDRTLHEEDSLNTEDEETKKGDAAEWIDSLFVEPTEDASLSTRLEFFSLRVFRNYSCNADVIKSGHHGLHRTVVREIICELKNLLYYGLVAVHNLKSEFHVDLLQIVFDIPHYVIQLKKHVISGAIIDLIESYTARFEAFLQDFTNVQRFIDTIKKCVPIFDIVETLNRLKIIVRRVFVHIGELLKHLEQYLNIVKEVLQDVKYHVSVVLEKISKFFYEYISTGIKEVESLVLKVISWVKLVLKNLISHVHEKFHRFLTILEELLDILLDFYKGYYASGVSQAIIDVIFLFCDSCKPPLTYNSSSSFTTTPASTECSCSTSNLDHSQDNSPTSVNENTTPSFFEPVINTHLPFPMYNLNALKQDSSDPDPVESSTSNPNSESELNRSNNLPDLTKLTEFASNEPTSSSTPLIPEEKTLSSPDKEDSTDDQGEVPNSFTTPSSLAPVTTDGSLKNEDSESVTPSYRLLRSFPQFKDSMTTTPSITAKKTPVLAKHSSQMLPSTLNSYRCGTSTYLPSFSSLNNILKDASIKQTSFALPRKEIASALGNSPLSSDDIIVIFLGNDRGLIGLVNDSFSQIDFKVYKLKSFFTNAQNNIKIWHLRSGDFHNPTCEHKFQLLFQN